MSEPLVTPNEDAVPMTFGKYRGSTPAQIAETDPSYVVWLYEGGYHTISRSLYLACEQEAADIHEALPRYRRNPTHRYR